LIFVYAAFAISSNLNIGHRHILVLYPPLFIFAGSISSLMLVFNKKFFNGAVFVLLALFIIDSLRIWPDYLAYFNILAGGPENAYEHLVDSSLDWGQDAHALQRRLKARGLTRNDVYLSFFGSMPYREFGIKARKLPCFFEQRQDEIFPLKGGVYCISATMLKLMPYPCLTQCGDLKNARFKACRKELSALFDAASDPEKVKRIVKEKGGENIRRIYAVYELLRFARLCRYLDNRLPDENVGYSILIFNLSDEEVQEALGDHR
jgi:hypothetical protein